MGLQPVRLPDSLRESLQRKEKTAIIVLEVESGSPAQKAGILIGDILLTLAGHPVAQLENVQLQLNAENIGRSLAAKIVRGGAVREFSITVGERPHGVN
jgi:S1-C subfamily serine protease